MEFTQQEVLAMLEESGRSSWNIRQMTRLRSEGFLPKLTPKRKPGTNKPLNVWDETDIEQIVDVYDWWDYCDGDRATLALILWLEGYEVSPDLLHGVYMPIIETILQKLTRGKTDPDDVLDEVSKLVVIWMRKMRYTPGLADQRKKFQQTMQRMRIFGPNLKTLQLSCGIFSHFRTCLRQSEPQHLNSGNKPETITYPSVMYSA